MTSWRKPLWVGASCCFSVNYPSHPPFLYFKGRLISHPSHTLPRFKNSGAQNKGNIQQLLSLSNKIPISICLIKKSLIKRLICLLNKYFSKSATYLYFEQLSTYHMIIFMITQSSKKVF